ncbi:MAG: VTT domain-containing protein, partial [Alphaproteobacteria bacterium]|nr:VTT domain-containing protein [Alphaproteobacteria bacterium]
NAVTLAVVAARLVPVLFFDIISDAAGLSPLRPWRFALATLLGIAPAGFVLAHFGGELGSGDLSRAATTVLALGGLTFASIAAGWWWRRRASL